MKRWTWILALLLTLAGCGFDNPELDRAMKLRTDMLASNCEFQAKVTADYGDVIQTFSMACHSDTAGELTFTVTEPESIGGITGTVSEEGGRLTFDDQALAFELLADGQLSPVSGPWVLMKTLRGGYVTACGMEDGRLRLAVEDSYEDDALRLDIWLDENDLPLRGEILWDGRRVLTVEVEGFEYL